MPGQDHLIDAVALLRAHVAHGVQAEHEFVELRGIDNDTDYCSLLFAQTRVAAMLVRALATEERRTPDQVINSLAVALLEVQALDDWR